MIVSACTEDTILQKVFTAIQIKIACYSHLLIHMQIMRRSKVTLLWCATPDAVLRVQDEWCSDVYFRQQEHDSLTHYLQARLQTSDNGHCLMAQVHSVLSFDAFVCLFVMCSLLDKFFFI